MRFARMDWYPWAFDEDELVRLLSWADQNAYMRILTVMWKWAEKHDTVDLPDDDYRIAGAIGIPVEEWQRLRARLVDHPAAVLKRDSDAGVIYSPRLRAEYAAALARHATAQANGRQGGRPRRPASDSDREAPPMVESMQPSRLPAENLSETYRLPVANPSLTHSQAHRSEIIDQESPDQDLNLTEPSVPADKPPRAPRGPRASAEAKAAATYLKTRLQAAGMTVFARDWHLKAAATADRLLRSGLAPPDLHALIDWCLSDPFWADKVTTMDKVADLVGRWQLQRQKGGEQHDAVVRAAHAGRHTDTGSLDALIYRAPG